MNLKKRNYFLLELVFIVSISTILFFSATFKNKTESKKTATLTQITHKPIKTVKEERNGSGELAIFHKIIRTKVGDDAPTYKTNYRQVELKKALKRNSKLKSTSFNLDWIERGPGNVSGRTRGLIIDPDDPTCNTWYAGSASGGIWKTSNAGDSWYNLTPQLQNLATSAIVQSQSNTNVLYAGNGEGFTTQMGIIGDGIYKSIDRGETWEHCESTVDNDDFKIVNRIVVDPNNEDIVLAATNTSIQKSIDGGISWKNVFHDNDRIQQIVAHPNDFNILYATSNGAGVLKSVDAGDSWFFCLRQIRSRAELAISPSNPEVIYVNDQEAHVFKSDDGGESWAYSAISSENLYAFRQNLWNNTLAVSPDNPNQVLIGCVDLYRYEVKGTLNDSINLLSAYSQNVDSFMDFHFNNQAYLRGSTIINPEKTNFKTIEIQFGPGKIQKAYRFLVPNDNAENSADSLYAFNDYVEVPFEVWDIENQRQLMVSFRDQDRNGAFNLYSANSYDDICREYIYIHDIDYSETPSLDVTKKGGQEFEQIAHIWPILSTNGNWNPNALPESKIVIEQKTFKLLNFNLSPLATNYNSFFPSIDLPYIHADLHNIQIVKKQDGSSRIVIANDGGVCFSDDDGKTWNNPLNGYNSSQIFGVDKHPTKNRYVAGIMDHGCYSSNENPAELSKWSNISGGDGFETVWNASDTNKIITSAYYNMLFASFDGGKTSRMVTSEIENYGYNHAPMFTQIGYSKNEPDKLYLAGLSGISISKDFGLTWKETAIPNSTWGWYNSSFVEPSLADPEVVWAASGMTNTAKIHLSVDGGETFAACNNYQEPLGVLSGLALHPFDRNTAYALFSIAGYPKILRTTNLGQSWEDLSGFENGKSNNGFPDVAVYSLLVMPNNPNEIWVGTEIGLFISTNNGESWKYADNGLPAITIWEMKVRSNQLVVATYGRGVWTLDIPELENVPQNPFIKNIGTIPSNKTNVQFQLTSVYDSLKMVVDKKYYSNNTIFHENSTIQTKAFNFDLEEGEHTIQLEAYKDNCLLKSSSQTFLAINYNESQYTYNNTIDEDTVDFVSNGDQIKVMSNEKIGEGLALHSTHPYPANCEFSCYLKTPIILPSNNEDLTLSYEDIPLIEEGEANSEYGSTDFYDYVIVEASSDGLTWKPLCDGYDYNVAKTLTVAMGGNIDKGPAPLQFIEHSLNLSNQFNKGDTLMIRFRLFSDANTTGWGWVIDNIDIQSQITVNSEVPLLITSIYPVPCSNQLNIKLSNNINGNTKLIVYDLNGCKIFEKLFTDQFQIPINTSSFKPSNYVLEIKNGKYVEYRKFQIRR